MKSNQIAKRCKLKTETENKFETTALFYKSPTWHERLVTESLEIALTQDVINKEDSAKLNNTSC